MFKIDTNKDMTAVSTGDNIVKKQRPPVKPGQRLLLFRNGKVDGYPSLMFDKTWKKDMKTKVKADIRKIEDLKIKCTKNPNDLSGKLLKLYESALNNIYNSVVCELIPIEIEKGVFCYDTVQICKITDIIGGKK